MMRLIFRDDGSLAEVHRSVPDALALPINGIDIAPSAAIEAAARAGRLTMHDGNLYLDGAPWVPDTDSVTLAEALAAIDAANSVANLKAILRRLAKLLAQAGVIDL